MSRAYEPTVRKDTGVPHARRYREKQKTQSGTGIIVRPFKPEIPKPMTGYSDYLMSGAELAMLTRT